MNFQILKTTKSRQSSRGVCSCFLPFVLVFVLLVVSLFSIADTTNAAVLTRPVNSLGLVGYWSFDDGSGTVATDFSGNGNHGVLNNMDAVDWVEGKRGKALDFDGEDDVLVISDNDVFDFINPQSFTLVAWIYADTINIADQRSIFAKWDGSPISERVYRVEIETDRTISVLLAATNDVINGNTVLETGRWYHVVTTVDPSTDTVRLYIDGEMDGENDDFSGQLEASDSDLRIGAYSESDQQFDGKVDEVRIYNRALSDDEVRALYNSGAVRFGLSRKLDDIAGLVGWWTFDGDSISGTAVVDMSGNGNDGTMVGGPMKTDGHIGQALRFNGIDQGVEVLDDSVFDFDTDDAFSVGGWVNVQSDSEIYALFTKIAHASPYRGYEITINSDKTLEVLLVSNWSVNNRLGVHSDTEITPNEWQHVLFTYDGSSDATGVTIYINGEEQSVTPIYNNLTGSILNDQSLHIANRDYDRYFLGGSIDDVRIYAKALSPAEVQRIYNATRPSTIGLTPTTSGTLLQGLVGHWSLDGSDLNWTSASTGTAVDRSGNGETGTLTNMDQKVSVTDGRIGQALVFDAESSAVIIEDALVESGPLSVCTWIRPNTISSDMTIFTIADTDTNSYAFELMLDGHQSDLRIDWLARFGTSADTTSVVDFEPGDWYHVCGVEYAHDLRSSFINGEKRASNTESKTPQGLDTTSIGVRKRSSESQFFDGVIDDVRVYNRALSDAEILQLYNMGR